MSVVKLLSRIVAPDNLTIDDTDDDDDSDPDNDQHKIATSLVREALASYGSRAERLRSELVD